MKEIKFRAYVKEKNKMFPVYSLDFSHVSDYFATIADCGDLDCGMCHEYYKREEVEIMQYTGFKDKNGIEIYEGDIVKGKNILGEIKYILERGCFMIHEAYGYTFIDYRNTPQTTYEVIGNIYENKDLL